MINHITDEEMRYAMTLEDIHIAGIDIGGRIKPDVSNNTVYVPYELSVEPPPQWKRMFLYTHNENPRFVHMGDLRNARIDGKHIIEQCDNNPEKIKGVYLQSLEKDIEYTNEQYRQFLERQENADLRQKQEETERLERVQYLKRQLSTDKDKDA